MKNDYKKYGYYIIDDFLPLDIANDLEKSYSKTNDWDIIEQFRENHYKHVHKTDSPYLPNEDEYYLAKFRRSSTLEMGIDKVFNKFFKPKMNEITNNNLSEFDVRCYKLDSGDFYRTHIDSYAGTVGCVYYLTKDWSWDWGGILNIAIEDDSLIPIFPKFNRLVIHDMKEFRFPHFISPVTDYAKNSRYTIVSFNK